MTPAATHFFGVFSICVLRYCFHHYELQYICFIHPIYCLEWTFFKLWILYELIWRAIEWHSNCLLTFWPWFGVFIFFSCVKFLDTPNIYFDRNCWIIQKGMRNQKGWAEFWGKKHIRVTLNEIGGNFNHYEVQNSASILVFEFVSYKLT